jgi:hypothetical protein
LSGYNLCVQTDTDLDLPDERPAIPLPRLLTGLLTRPRPTFAEAFDETAQPGKAWLVIALLTLVAVVIASGLNTAQLVAGAFAGAPADPGINQGNFSAAAPAAPVDPGSTPGASPLTMLMGGLPAALGVVIGWLVWALLLQVGGTLVGGRGQFGTLFKVVVLAGLPLMLRALIQIGALLTGGRAIMNPGFAGFLPAEPGALNVLLRSLLSSIDLFQVWSLVLLAIGTTVVARMTHRKAGILILVCGLLIIVVSALPSIVFSGIAG